MKKRQLRLLPAMLLLLGTFAVISVYIVARISSKEKKATSIANAGMSYVNQMSHLENAVQYHLESLGGYVHGGDKNNVKKAYASLELSLQVFDSVKNNLKNEPGLKQDLDSLEYYLNKRDSLSAQIISTGKEKGLQEAIAAFSGVPVYKYFNEIFTSVRQMQYKVMQQVQLDINANAKSIDQFRAVLSIPVFLAFLIIFLIFRSFLLNFSVSKRVERQLKNYNDELQENVANKTAEIRQSEERYRTLVEQASDAIVITDLDGNLLDVNDSTCKMSGYSREELLRLNIRDLVIQESENQVQDAMDRLVQGEKLLNERKARKKDGTNIIIESNTRLITDGRVLTINRDITERKKTEEALKASEFNSRLVVENKILGVGWCSPEGTVTNANKALCEMLEGSPDEMKGKHFIDFSHPDDVREEYELLDKMARGEINNYVIEKRVMKRSGIYFWAEVNVTCHRKPGTGDIDFFIALIHDIHQQKKFEEELKASEKKLRQVLSSYGEMFYVVDKQGKILLINELAKKNLSVFWGKPVDLGGYLPDLTPETNKELLKERLQKVLNGETMEYEAPVNVTGQPAWYQVSMFPVRDDDGIIYGVYIYTKDITGKKTAEEKLRQSVNRFEMISLAVNDALWEWDLETGELWANETHQRLYGLTIDDPVPTEEIWLEHVHPDERAEMKKKQVESLQSEKTIFTSEYRFKPKGSNEYKYVYDRTFILRNNKGEPLKKMGSMVDITERIRMEEELKEAETKFRTLVEQSLVGVYIVQDGVYAYANPCLAEMMGYTQTEMIRTFPVDHVVHPDHRQIVADNIRIRMEGKVESVHYEINAMKKNGEVFPIELFGTRTLYQGRPAIIGTLLDVSVRKRAENELKRSEERYRTLVEQASDYIMITDLDGNFIDVNPSLCKALGYEREKLLKMEANEIFDPLQVKEEPLQFDLLVTGISIIRERKMLSKEGELIDVEINKKMLPDGRVLSISRDIRARKKAEAEIRKAKELSDHIIDSLPGVFYLFDENGIFLRWNKRFEMITGYTGTEVLNMRPWQFFEGEEVEYISERIKGVLQKGYNDAEAHFVTKEGKKIPFFFSAERILYEDRVCIVGHGLDISERKKAAEQLEESYEAIRRLSEHLQNVREEERAHIAREIHDELGQQLTVLKMDVSWLNKKLQHTGEDIDQKLEDLLGLIDSTVKTVRRISSELRPSLLDDMGLVPAMEWHLKEFEKRVLVKTKFKSFSDDINLPNTVKTGLFRIFQESLTNVARHADAKKVDVNIENENGNIVLCIKDDGKGIDLEKAKAKKTLGILGMQERIYMMGGNYKIKSNPGKGTKIIVSVPYAGSN